MLLIFNNRIKIFSLFFFYIVEDYTLADSKASSRSESISDDDDDIGSNDKQLDLVQDQDMNEDNDFLDLSYYKR